MLIRVRPGLVRTARVHVTRDGSDHRVRHFMSWYIRRDQCNSVYPWPFDIAG